MMTKNPLLTFCATIALVISCSKFANAQSAVPGKQAPIERELSLEDLTIRRTIVGYTTDAQLVRKELQKIEETRVKAFHRLKSLESLEDESGVSVESFPEIVKNLQAKKIDLMIDLAGLKAKRDAILAARKDVPDKSIVATLEKIVALKQDQLQQQQREGAAGKIKSTAVRSAELDLLASRVQLADAKSEKNKSSLLADSLLSTSLALAESYARLAKTESLLDEILPSRKKLESSRQLREQHDRYITAQDELTKQLRSIERNIARLSAELEVKPKRK